MSDFSFTTDWYPYYLNGTSWDRFSVAIEKPYVYTTPTEIAVAYVTNNVAYLGKSSIAAINVLAGIEQIGPAIDASICYDARWYLGSNKEYIIYTTGTLFIAFVDTAHNLNVKMNITGAQLKLASGVDKCFIVRGWKHISDINIDQGINVFYTKNGQLFYRSYIQTDERLFDWQDEQLINTSKPVSDIQVYRTADFRLAICLTYTDSTNQLLLTDRVFPGQSIPIETVNTVMSTDNNVVVHPIMSVEQDFNDSVSITSSTNISMLTYGSFDNSNVSAKNVGGDKIYLAIPTRIPDANLQSFCQNSNVVDAQGNGYPILEASYSGDWLIVYMADFNNAVGSMTFSYNGNTAGYLGLMVHAFTTTFNPVGLVPTPPDPPVPVTSINVNSEVI